MHKYILLNRKKVLTARAFDVEKVFYQLPDGSQKAYDLVDHADAVTLLAINENHEIYFVRQYRIGSENVLLELPAGVLDQDEQPQTAARRELREEIGMDAESYKKLGGFYMTPGYSNEYMYIYLAKELHSAPLEADDDEFLDVIRIPCAKAYEMAFSGEIQDGKTLTALFIAYPYLKDLLGNS